MDMGRWLAVVLQPRLTQAVSWEISLDGVDIILMQPGFIT